MKDFLKVVFKILSGAKIFLIIFFFGSSVFASSSDVNFLIQETDEKKDISVFVDKLGERLKGVLREIIIMSTDGKDLFTGGISSGSADLVDLPKNNIVDIVGHKYEDEIRDMIELGVIDANREKFYPDNYLRRYEAVIILTKYRLAKSGQGLSAVAFPLRGWFFDVAQNTSYAPYVAYAEQKGWIDSMISDKDGKKMFYPNKFLTSKEICNMLQVDVSNSFCSENIIKRGEFVSLLSRGFSNISEDKSDSDVNYDNVDSQQANSSVFQQAKTLFSFVAKK